ncbi:MAG: hypothetical protein WCG26_09995, partial [Chloroflexales bacterium]
MPEPTYRDERALVTYLIQELERRLAGRDQPILWRTAPGDVCHLGVLAPGGPANPDAAAVVIPLARVNPPHDGAAETEARVRRGRGISPTPPTRQGLTTLGLQLLVRPDAEGRIALRIRSRFSIYTRHLAPWARQRQELGDLDTAGPVPRVRLVDGAVRRTVRPEAVTLVLTRDAIPARLDDAGRVQAALDAVLTVAAADPDQPLWRPGVQLDTIPVTDLATPATYAAFLAGLTAPPPSLLLRADLEMRPRLTPSGAVRIPIYLRNTTPTDALGDPFNLLVDSALEVSLRHGTLVPIELVPTPDDYQIDRAVWALGHGTSVVVATNRRVVRTVALAQVAQPRRSSRDDPPARLADLAADPLPVLVDLATAMTAYHTTWADAVAAWVAAGPGTRDPAVWAQERAARQRDCTAFATEVAQFAEGIAALQADPLLALAFQAMHRAMARAAHGRYDRWRRFQIIFLVSQLPALAARSHRERVPRWAALLDRADVLWFPTGGGKTEAYLGLIVCAILYDRLRGKMGGVTAWLRFPLRMLSVQQVQRASAVIWETEQERVALEVTGGRPLGDPIALGYLVGKDLTPNSLRVGDPQWPLDQIAHDPTLRERVHLIRHCPACRGTGTVTVDVDVPLARIQQRCTACGAVLPVYVSDNEILRFLPALVIGTVDKIASVAYRATLAMLWAGPVWRCPVPGHGYGAGRWCSVPDCPTNPTGTRVPRTRPPVQIHDPAPALIVQDELHLIEQELGAFAGHYETMVRGEAAQHSGLPPKIVAATATIAGLDHQARQLYGVRGALRFPGRDRQRDETCYTTVPHDVGGHPHSARILVGFQPPHLTPVNAAV